MTVFRNSSDDPRGGSFKREFKDASFSEGLNSEKNGSSSKEDDFLGELMESHDDKKSNANVKP